MKKLGFSVSLVVTLSMIAALQAQGPEKPLRNSRISVLKGWVVPEHTREINAQKVTVPDGCGFHVVLPPGQKALEWRQRATPVIDRATNTCEAEFEEGVPEEFAEPDPGKQAQPQNAEAAKTRLARRPASSLADVLKLDGSTPPVKYWLTSAGYLKVWWVDPVSITVNSTQANVTWTGFGKQVGTPLIPGIPEV